MGAGGNSRGWPIPSRGAGDGEFFSSFWEAPSQRFFRFITNECFKSLNDKYQKNLGKGAPLSVEVLSNSRMEVCGWQCGGGVQWTTQ